VVRAWLNWPDRGPEPYVRGIAPENNALLVGFAADVAFSRSADGTLVYREQLRTMVF
jgi:hypothetical protein